MIPSGKSKGSRSCGLFGCWIFTKQYFLPLHHEETNLQTILLFYLAYFQSE
jgi:hypothetical protein